MWIPTLSVLLRRCYNRSCLQTASISAQKRVDDVVLSEMRDIFLGVFGEDWLPSFGCMLAGLNTQTSFGTGCMLSLGYTLLASVEALGYTLLASVEGDRCCSHQRLLHGSR
eukprot:gene21808-biopygen7596